jgi:hypothetical protein
MKYLQLLLLLFSCTTPQKQVLPTPLFWDIIEGYNTLWNKKQIIKRLGKPQEIIKQENKDLWVYNSPKTNYQIWAVGITLENKVSGLAYFPSAPEKKLYIFEVEQRWKSLNCVHKKETKLSADNFQTTRTLECDDGKKVAEYNKYNEVLGISVK